MEPINAVTNEQVLQNLNPSGGHKKWLISIFAFLLVVILSIGGYFAYNLLFAPVGETVSQTAQDITPLPVVPVSDAEARFLSRTTTYKVGAKVPVDVQVKTNGRFIGKIELSIKFDPKKLSVDQNVFTKTAIFTSDPLVTVDKNKGTVRVIGTLGSASEGYNGIGLIGAVNFVATADGGTAIDGSGFSKVTKLDLVITK